MENIIIIGNGISGITAAKHIRKKSNANITVISSETKYFFSRTALMYIYMGHMKFEHTQPYEPWFWEKNKINLIQDYVETIDFKNKSLSLKEGTTVYYDKLILAVGSKPNKFGWPGQDLKGVQGLYSYQDLLELEENTKNGIKRAVIVGGGLIGIELAEMLLSRNFPVTFLVREKFFWGNVLPPKESQLIMRHMAEHHIDLKTNTELKEIVPDSSGKVKSIITNHGEEIECELVGLTAGVSPNVDFLKNSELEIDRGILVNEFLETNQKDVFAIGDCAQFKQHPKKDRKPIEQVWYTGRMMGETVASTICGKRLAYNPGNWFNSAKFFDIEYQTYGWVFSKPLKNEEHFYWENSCGKIALTIAYDKESRLFHGINVYGLRMRHHAFDKWLTEKRTVEYILEHLKDANFDPEFYKSYEPEILNEFNLKNSTYVKPKAKSWKRILYFNS